MGNDGGPAFPCFTERACCGKSKPASENGMTIRDYFAAKAMQGLCANGQAIAASRFGAPNKEAEFLSAAAFHLADAMLAERAKEPK